MEIDRIAPNAIITKVDVWCSPFRRVKSQLSKVRRNAPRLILGKQLGLNVRFTPKSGHWSSVSECPLCAKSRLVRRNNFIIYFAPSTTSGGLDADTLPCPHASFGPFPGKFTGIT